MEVIHPRCAGIDISKEDAKVCVRVQGSGSRATASTVTTWSSMSAQILDLKDLVLNEHVSLVVMEATGDYWRPSYYLLEDDGLEVVLVNARGARNRSRPENRCLRRRGTEDRPRPRIRHLIIAGRIFATVALDLAALTAGSKLRHS
jgi:transposase